MDQGGSRDHKDSADQVDQGGSRDHKDSADQVVGQGEKNFPWGDTSYQEKKLTPP